jgi:hypothetical protein
MELEFPRLSGHLAACAAVARKDGVWAEVSEPHIRRRSASRLSSCCVPAVRLVSCLRASASRSRCCAIGAARTRSDRRKRDDGLLSDERKELRRLRRENARLTQERKLLKRAAAFFA